MGWHVTSDHAQFTSLLLLSEKAGACSHMAASSESATATPVALALLMLVLQHQGVGSVPAGVETALETWRLGGGILFIY